MRWSFALVLSLVVAGCGDAFGPTRPFTPITLTKPGTPTQFDVAVFNGTQFPLIATVTTASPSGAPNPTVQIQIGETGRIELGYLPESITLDVMEYRSPSPYSFPTKVLLLGKDYGFNDHETVISYPIAPNPVAPASTPAQSAPPASPSP